MGDRRNVRLNYGYDKSSVYLYTHWGGSELPIDVAEALRLGKDRWDDPPYLARIIFSHLVGEDWDTNVGYGIDIKPVSDAALPMVIVDLWRQVVRIGEEEWSFEDYCNQYAV